ncbi:hypothetical protein ACFORL_10855 [Legionella dresdenensis]|uniref:Substrate of the Dot/Icm secretion system n=1 Tax=Legionella dresdenensis TaxID=450200 RepID=A0ABV8CGW6_9GAMM
MRNYTERDRQNVMNEFVQTLNAWPGSQQFPTLLQSEGPRQAVISHIRAGISANEINLELIKLIIKNNHFSKEENEEFFSTCLALLIQYYYENVLHGKPVDFKFPIEKKTLNLSENRYRFEARFAGEIYQNLTSTSERDSNNGPSL